MAERKVRRNNVPKSSLKTCQKATGCHNKGNVFNPDLPPQQLTLKRLTKQVDDVKNDLHVAKVNPAVKDNLAYSKLSKNSKENKQFRKQCSKKADIDKDDQLYNSLVNVSISSVESLKSLENLDKLAVPIASSKFSEPAPKLDNFFQPYQGEHEEYSPDGELLESIFLKRNVKHQRLNANRLTKNMREALFKKLDDLDFL